MRALARRAQARGAAGGGGPGEAALRLAAWGGGKLAARGQAVAKPREGWCGENISERGAGLR